MRKKKGRERKEMKGDNERKKNGIEQKDKRKKTA